ncbi:hypothetical protein P4S72_06805 [Vibrio sp. PP-XX7]
MQTQKTKYENEFEQELPAQVVEHFNTLQSYSAQPTTLLRDHSSGYVRVVDAQCPSPASSNHK